jgi:TP901-1 family phage major tail protein
MAGQKGKELLIKRGDGASPETFTAVAGLRTKTVSFNKETVDITNSDSANNWRELLAGAGIKTLDVSGSGVFTDSTVEGNLRADMFGSVFSNYQIVIPGLGTFEGAFDMPTLEYAGEHNGEATYSMSLASAGEITFSAS